MRRGSQVLFAALFVVAFLANRYPSTGSSGESLFLRMSPILPLADALERFPIGRSLWPGWVVVVLTVFLGRFFCGWVCPLGSFLDLVRGIPSRAPLSVSRWQAGLSRLPYLLLLFLLVFLPFGINLLGFLDPLSLAYRTLTIVIFPLVTWAVLGAFLAVGTVPIVGPVSSSCAALWREWIVPEGASTHVHVWSIALVLTILVSFELVTPRFWCRFLCPSGAWLGIVSKLAFYRRSIAQSCTCCGSCLGTCPMGAIPESDPRRTRLDLCTLCLDCVGTCPPGIDAASFRWTARGPRSSTDEPDGRPTDATPTDRSGIDLTRRELLSTVLGSVTVIGMNRIMMRDPLLSARLLRPPGSLPESEFLGRCIRCMACVRVCRSNGGCLQPGVIHSDLLELWVPEAKMRVGYCEHNCNLCGPVCPTGAIVPLTLEQKQKTPIGLAVFDRDLCIPFVHHKDCLVCEEHCPIPEKAIRFDSREAVLHDGSRRVVKYPYVVREKCTGCGICETKCPLTGDPGIFVISQGAIRPRHSS